MALEAGTQAPDFSLHTTPDQSVALREFRGRRLVLAFYPRGLTRIALTTFGRRDGA